MPTKIFLSLAIIVYGPDQKLATISMQICHLTQTETSLRQLSIVEAD